MLIFREKYLRYTCYTCTHETSWLAFFSVIHTGIRNRISLKETLEIKQFNQTFCGKNCLSGAYPSTMCRIKTFDKFIV